MTAYVLCPGPSLANWEDSRLRAAPIRIGVNRAVHRVTCTHWCFCDDLQFDPSRRPTRIPHVFTSASCLFNIEQSRWPLPIQRTTFEQMYDRHPININDRGLGTVAWSTYSATAALMSAAFIGADRIQVYGADWTNAADWDGHQIPTNKRDAQRWQEEAQIWNAVVAYLADRRILVARMFMKDPTAEAAC